VRVEDQVVRYAEVGGRQVAWTAVGRGPALVMGGWWSSNLSLDWADESFRSFVAALAQEHTVIRYDRPGSGRSDRRAGVPETLDGALDVLTQLLDHLAEDEPHVLSWPVALFGGSAGCAVAAAYAAVHPDKVSRLVLYGAYARGEDLASPQARQTLLAVVEQHWGLGSRVLTDLFMPGATAAERDAFVDFQRRSATPEVAAASLRAVYEFDAAAYLRDIRVPTAVLHRRDDRAIPFALGRQVASLVPAATFVELAGEHHFPWMGPSRPVLDAVLAVLAGRVPQPRRATAIATEPALTARERQVLELVAQGHTDVQIAERLLLSPHTVHRHVANARTKLGVPTRSAAAAWALLHQP
jgi:pimeloyl-ACP methyl ester carboxylesterase/DNA-binding CsgD family transcriptional regulator